MKRNKVVIDCRVLKRRTLRYTPAGIPAIDLLIGHRSIQLEAGRERMARCEMEAVALGDIALKVSTLKVNEPVQIRGFLARRSLNDGKLVLHIGNVGAVGTSEQPKNMKSGDKP